MYALGGGSAKAVLAGGTHGVASNHPRGAPVGLLTVRCPLKVMLTTAVGCSQVPWIGGRRVPARIRAQVPQDLSGKVLALLATMEGTQAQPVEKLQNNPLGFSAKMVLGHSAAPPSEAAPFAEAPLSPFGGNPFGPGPLQPPVSKSQSVGSPQNMPRLSPLPLLDTPLSSAAGTLSGHGPVHLPVNKS